MNPVTFGEKNKKMFDIDISATNISIEFLKDSGYLKYDASGNIIYNKTSVGLSGNYKTKVKFYQYTTRGPSTINSISLYSNVNPEMTLDLSSLVQCRSYGLQARQITSIVFPTTDVSVNLGIQQNKLQTLDLTQ